jgi:hypothetical protein
LKRYKSPGTDEIQAELIQAGGETLHSEIHNLIHSVWNKEELPQQCKESVTVPIYREVLYIILTEFGVPMKLVRLIIMYLNETYSKVRMVIHLSDIFPIENGLKQDALLSFIICH